MKVGVRCQPSQMLGTCAIRVLDSRSATIRTLVEGPPHPPLAFLWDGKDEEGRDVSAGAYRVRFETDRGAVELSLCRRTGVLAPSLRRNSIDAPIRPLEASRTGL
jgi:flagellar hook assembly protein FlgD